MAGGFCRSFTPVNEIPNIVIGAADLIRQGCKANFDSVAPLAMPISVPVSIFADPASQLDFKDAIVLYGRLFGHEDAKKCYSRGMMIKKNWPNEELSARRKCTAKWQ